MSLGVMPLSAEALCWKKIIHGVTVAPMVEATSSSSVLKLPPGKGLKASERPSEPMSGRTSTAARMNRQVEEGKAEHDALPTPVAPAAEREDDEREPERDGDAGAEVEVGEPDADGDELGDERDEVGEREVGGAEPAPHATVALQHELAVAAVGDGADAHAHLLADIGHGEQHGDERHEEAEAVLGAVGGVGDHARPVVLAEHREDAGADEQPQQAPAAAVRACGVHAGAVVGARGVLFGGERRAEEGGGGELGGAHARPPSSASRAREGPWTSTRMAPARRPPMRVLALAEADEQRAAEGLALEHLEALAGRDLALGEVAEHLGVGVGHAHEPAGVAGLEALEAVGGALVELELGGGDGVAVGVDGGVAELGGDQLLEVVGEHVLEHLRLGVHTVPRHAQGLGEVALEQAVVADHLERDAASVSGEADATVGGVGDQAELVEAPQHGRDGARGDAEPLGQRVRGDGLVAARFQGEDGLRVVLHGWRAGEILG